jgi:hypothetical protein
MLYSKYYALRKQHEQGESVIQSFKTNMNNASVDLLVLSSQTVKTAVNMPKDLLELFTLQKDFSDTAIADMEKLLTRQFGDNLFCCMFRFLGAQEIKVLKTIKVLLRFMLNKHAVYLQDIGNQLGNILNTIVRSILGELFKILYQGIIEINRWIKTILTDYNKVISSTGIENKCISWELFVQTLLQYIEELENSVLALTLEFRSSLKQQNEYTRLYLEAMTKSKYIKRLLRLIDIILEAKANGELCKQTAAPTDQEILDLYAVYQNDPDFGGSSATGLSGSASSRSSSVSTNRVVFDDCLKKVPKEDVEMVLNWITRLRE